MFRIKNISIAIVITLLSGFTAIAAAEKEVADYINDLKSPEVKTVVDAANYLGEEEEKDAVQPLIDAITTQKNPKMRIAMIAALSRMDEKGKPTSFLRHIVEDEKNNHVVYTALLAILNLKDFENADVKIAVDYCDINKKDDAFIVDVITKLKLKIQEAQAE